MLIRLFAAAGSNVGLGVHVERILVEVWEGKGPVAGVDDAVIAPVPFAASVAEAGESAAESVGAAVAIRDVQPTTPTAANSSPRVVLKLGNTRVESRVNPHLPRS